MKLILLTVVLLTGIGAVADGQVVLYTKCNYKGETAVLQPGNYRDPSSFRLSGKNIASLIVPVGFVVELYTDSALVGQPFIIRSNVSCFPPQWENLIKSIRIIYQAGKPVAYHSRPAVN